VFVLSLKRGVNESPDEPVPHMPLKRIESLGTLALLLLVIQAVYSQSHTATNAKTKVFLQDGWKFHQVGDTDWRPAIVPGCVHTDLLRNKMIDDPFYRDHETNLQWIGKTDWEYETTFNVTPELLKRENIELVFDGLDTYANVFLN